MLIKNKNGKSSVFMNSKPLQITENEDKGAIQQICYLIETITTGQRFQKLEYGCLEVEFCHFIHSPTTHSYSVGI